MKGSRGARSASVEMKVRRSQDGRGRDVFKAEFLPVKELTVAHLPALDRGLVAGEIDAAFRQALASCDAMPHVTKARKVVVQFDLAPKGGDPMRGCDRVDVTVQIAVKTPDETEDMFEGVEEKEEGGNG